MKMSFRFKWSAVTALILTLAITSLSLVALGTMSLAHAADAGSVLNNPDVQSFLMSFIGTFAVKFPVITTVLVWMGGARIVFKPICACIQAYVDWTPSKTDDQWWATLQENGIFKVILAVLNYTASIKLPEPSKS